uniref:Mediator of RNA polymerase II transcription subunit 15 n=1 Tax=Acrobeloides nanus TaxID=290746 RepID=A0A914D4Q3_9BILA
MGDEDWRSQTFRDRIINRLDLVIKELEEEQSHQNNPNPMPNTALQMEEAVFQKCSSKEEYLKSISKVITSIKAQVISASLDRELE